ncbi:MAG: hypothetical protein KBT27_11420 [Prevotellaceae bacterium]|nr:hypothetical protein [Candidatus Faecinaster equi]
MIRRTVCIDSVDWNVILYVNADKMDTDCIIDDIIQSGCKGEQLSYIKKKLWTSEYDGGFIFTKGRNSVIVVGKSSSIRQMINTLVHESHHLIVHIATEFNMDPYGEEASYMAGDVISELLYKALDGVE